MLIELMISDAMRIRHKPTAYTKSTNLFSSTRPTNPITVNASSTMVSIKFPLADDDDNDDTDTDTDDDDSEDDDDDDEKSKQLRNVAVNCSTMFTRSKLLMTNFILVCLFVCSFG